MSLVRRYFNFYISANIHVALAVWCLVKITLMIYGIQSDLTPFFCFVATVTSYNFIRIYHAKELKPFMLQWTIRNQSILKIVIGLGLVVLAILSVQLTLLSWVWMIVFFAATLFYIIPYSKHRQSLRGTAGVKLFLISLTWAGVTVIFPLVQNHISLDINVVWIFLQRLLFVIAITIPFDIRDVNFDNERLHTLPQKFGITGAKIIGYSCMMIYLMIRFLIHPFYPLWIDLILVLLVVLGLFFSSQTQSKYYASFWVEGIPIAWYFILLLDKFVF